MTLTGSLCLVQNMNPSMLQQGPTYLPSEGVVEEVIIKDAVSVSSADGESFTLVDKVGSNQNSLL